VNDRVLIGLLLMFAVLAAVFVVLMQR